MPNTCKRDQTSSSADDDVWVITQHHDDHVYHNKLSWKTLCRRKEFCEFNTNIPNNQQSWDFLLNWNENKGLVCCVIRELLHNDTTHFNPVDYKNVILFFLSIYFITNVGFILPNVALDLQRKVVLKQTCRLRLDGWSILPQCNTGLIQQLSGVVVFSSMMYGLPFQFVQLSEPQHLYCKIFMEMRYENWMYTEQPNFT